MQHTNKQDINMAIGTLPPELFAEQQQLNRQQQMAQLLMQQGQQMPQAQMVSGRYVAPSIFQNLAPLLQTYMGNRLAEKGDERSLALAAKLRERQGQDVKSYMQAMTPTTTEMAGPYGVSGAGQNVPMPTATQGPDYAKAFQVAYNSYDPALRAQAMEMIKTQKLGPDETLNRMDFATGQLVPIGQGGGSLAGVVKEAAQLLGITKPRNQWTEQDLAAVNQKATELKKLTGSTVNIPNFTEKTFAGGLAESQVKKFDTLQTNAEKAPDVLRSVAESKAILKSGKFFSGSPANVQLEMAKMADALGLGGKETKDKAANTQTLITNAAGSTLDSIAGSGLGAGQGFTDKDLKFLQEAKSFRIDMTDANIARVIDLQERAARASVDRYNQRLRTLPQQSIQQMGLTPITLPRSADEIIKD
jgi:hypothetical protein